MLRLHLKGNDRRVNWKIHNYNILNLLCCELASVFFKNKISPKCERLVVGWP